MKFVFTGDFHNEEMTPLARLDNWQETLDSKAKEIQDIAHSINARAIIQPGDFLNRPKIQESYMQTILKRWSHVKPNEILLNEKTLDGSIPMLGVVGNHELFGNSLSNFNKTSLAVLEEIGFLRLVDRKPLILEEDGMKIAITGTGYYPGIDRDVNGYIVKEKLGDIHIHIVHGYGTFKDLGELIPHCNLTKYADETKADITIIGHDHIGFGIREVNGKIFVNPGAAVRLSAALDEIDREVKVGIIDIHPHYERGFDVQLVPLKSAKAGDEVLSREHIIAQKNKEEFTKKIAEQVEKVKVNSHATIKDIVDEIAQNSNIDSEVKTRLLDRFNEKMQNVPTQDKVDDYKIKSLHLVNFQSHKDTLLNFGKLNVFTGPSGSGKTSILRAFSWVFEDKIKNSRRLIHKDETFASATIELDNGIKITRKVERKKTGFNGYIIEYADGTIETLNTKGLPVVQKLLGFHYLTTSEDKTQNGLNLNFLKQGEGWFFIGPEIAGSERAKMIGAIYKTHIADAVQKDLALEAKRKAAVLKEKEAEVEKLQLEIDTMVHIEKMQKCIEEAEPIIARIEELKTKLAKYDELNSKKQNLEKKMLNLDNALQELSGIQQAKDVAFMLRQRLFVADKIKQTDNIRQNMNGIVMALNRLKKVSVFENEVAELKSKVQKFEKISEFENKKKHLYSEMHKARNIITKLETLLEHQQVVKDLKAKVELNGTVEAKFKERVELVKKMNDVHDKILVLTDVSAAVSPALSRLREKVLAYDTIDATWDKLEASKNQIDKNKDELKEQATLLKTLKHEYWDGLKELDICPTCLQKISEEARTNMARRRTREE